MPAALLFENIDFAGYPFSIEVGQNVPTLPPPMGSGEGQASSMYVYGPSWITFWESPNYSEGDDSLWIAPPPHGSYWLLKNLHELCRPHGTNHWGDRIRGVSFSGAPTGSNENRTVINANGSGICGNDLLLSPHEFKDKYGLEIVQASLGSAFSADGGELPTAIEAEALRQQKMGTLGDLDRLWETMNICASSPTPAGWIKVNDHWSPTSCGNPTMIVYNVTTIARYDNLPVNSQITVCAGAPTPAGWVEIGNHWSPTSCGYPPYIVNNVKTIRRIA